MGVAKADNNQSIQPGDISAIALVIYLARLHGLQTVLVSMHGFDFYCDPLNGEVEQAPKQIGGVTHKLGKTSAEAYIFSIQQGLSLAAKMYLLTELKKTDSAFDTMINVNVESGVNADEGSVNAALSRLVQARGTTLSTIFGMFSVSPPQSAAMQVAREELQKASIKSINTFQDADQLFQNITQKLLARQTRPRPQ